MTTWLSICWLIPQMKRVPAPCRIAKNISIVPSQMWYLTEASNWIPSNLNTDNPLKIGKRRKARQISPIRPNLVDILRNLSCHLKYNTFFCYLNHVFLHHNLNTYVVRKQLGFQKGTCVKEHENLRFHPFPCFIAGH